MSETKHEKRTRAQWEQLMARYEAGNLTQRAFCAQRGIAYSSFCYWRKQLRMPEGVENPVPLIELAALPSSKVPAWRVELDPAHGHEEVVRWLVGAGEERVARDPFSGHLFVFINRKRNQTTFRIPIAICRC